MHSKPKAIIWHKVSLHSAEWIDKTEDYIFPLENWNKNIFKL